MKEINVYADWIGMDRLLVGKLSIDVARGKEVARFRYSEDWLDSGHCMEIDPELGLYKGDMHPKSHHANFRAFLDSSPDRWGRLLMKRREAINARMEDRAEKTLTESDYLLGVHDSYRMGGLRYQLEGNDVFLGDDESLSAPPVTSLRELEHAVNVIEDNKYIPSDEYLEEYRKWLNILISPGSSLGGARPKACVTDAENTLWIAKFPSKEDEFDVGAWEYVAYQMATSAGIEMNTCQIVKFKGDHNTFLSQRFDRTTTDKGIERIHFTSAMTQLGYYDGKQDEGGGFYQSDQLAHPASYLELAAFIVDKGGNIHSDLAQLWLRIVFSIVIKNTDDHLRNHGFLLMDKGWVLSPAYDINPNPDGAGLNLNISESSNELDLGLAMQQIEHFRLSKEEALSIIDEVFSATQKYTYFAEKAGISAQEIKMMSRAFMSADEKQKQLSGYCLSK